MQEAEGTSDVRAAGRGNLFNAPKLNSRAEQVTEMHLRGKLIRGEDWR